MSKKSPYDTYDDNNIIVRTIRDLLSGKLHEVFDRLSGHDYMIKYAHPEITIYRNGAWIFRHPFDKFKGTLVFFYDPKMNERETVNMFYTGYANNRFHTDKFYKMMLELGVGKVCDEAFSTSNGFVRCGGEHGKSVLREMEERYAMFTKLMKGAENA